MPATLLFRQEEQRLVAPIEAISAEPEGLVRAPAALDDPLDADLDGVTAIVDQAFALAERNPRSPTARARLAHAQLAAGRVDDARRSAHQVLNDSAALDDAPALVAAATVLVSVGDSESAEKALALLGGRRFPHLFAQLAVQRKEWETALARLDGFTDPTSGELRGWVELQRHHYREAIRSFRAVIASSESASPDLYINLGYSYAVLGSLRKAIRTTKVAVALSPASRTAGFNLAAFHTAAGDLTAALSALVQVREHHPDDLAPRLAIASTLARSGDFKGAERALRQADEQTRWNGNVIERATIQANLVTVRHSQGQIDAHDAYKSVRAILERIGYSDLGIARLLLWWMYSTTQADDAKHLLQELARRFPAHQLGPFRTQAALLRLDFDTAIEEARRWVDDEPFDPSGVANLTYLLIEAQDEFDEAIQIGRAALQRMPSDVVIRNNTAYAFVQLGKFVDAAKMLANPACTTDPLCMATTGLLKIRQGQIEEGLTLYEQAAERADAANAHLLADMIRQRVEIEARAVGRKPELDHDVGQRYRTDPRFVLATRRSGQSTSNSNPPTTFSELP